MRAAASGLLVLCVATSSFGQGYAFNENLSVLAPEQQLADDVLTQAVICRDMAARQWLGRPLADGEGPVLITVRLMPGDDRGLTMPRSGEKRTKHLVWLTFSPGADFRHILHHEMVHCVLQTRYAGQLPVCFEEGAASLTDDEQRRAIYRRELLRAAMQRQWPSLERLLRAEQIPASDQLSYSTASSLTEFLLTRGDHRHLLGFAVAGRKVGWNAAVRQYYGLRDLAALQAAWQDYVLTTLCMPPATAAAQ